MFDGIPNYGMRGRVNPVPRDAYEELVGADEIVAGWHCVDAGPGIVSSNVNTLRDRYRGLLLSAPASGQRPTWVNDGTNFHSQKVLGCTGTRCLAVSGLSANIATSRPCTIVRYRYNAAPVTNNGIVYTLFGLGVAGASDTQRTGAKGDGALFNGPGLAAGGSTVLVTGPSPGDTSAHNCATWLDGVNANSRVDATTYSAANAGSIGPATAVSIGKAASGNYHNADAFIAAVFLLRRFPGTTKLTQFFALLSSEY